MRDVEVASGGEDEQEGRIEGRNRRDWRFKFYVRPNQTTGDIVCKVRNVRSEHTSNIAAKNKVSSNKNTTRIFFNAISLLALSGTNYLAREA